jgi:hypothetical protein
VKLTHSFPFTAEIMTECVNSIPDTRLHGLHRSISAFIKVICGLFNNSANVLAHKFHYTFITVNNKFERIWIEVVVVELRKNTMAVTWTGC